MVSTFKDRSARDLEIARRGRHVWNGKRCTRCYEHRHSETISLRCPGSPTILIDTGPRHVHAGGGADE